MHLYLTWSVVLCLQALSKTLTEDELFYLHTQFMLLEPNKSGRISFENFRQVCGHFLALSSFLYISSGSQIICEVDGTSSAYIGDITN